MRYWVYRYDESKQGYSPAGAGYTDREDQAVGYCEGHSDLAIYRYDHSALPPGLIPSPKLSNGSFLEGRRMGRPPMTDGQRSAFVGANVTPDLKEWATSQPEGISSLVNRLLNEEREVRNTQRGMSAGQGWPERG